MKTLLIPKQPDALPIVIDHLWNGEACANEGFHALVWLSQNERGLAVRAEAVLRNDMRIPNAPIGERLDGLWEYDVVELFLVGENGHYLEIELGAGGHWLILGFDDIRHRSNEYVNFKPEYHHAVMGDRWQSEIIIPWDMVPRPLARLNAYAILGGEFLAYAPVPGAKPDYHQPSVFPKVEIAGKLPRLV